MSSSSSSESLLKLFKGKHSADELLKSDTIIKKMFIGISYLDNKNPNSLPRLIFGDIISHASLFFMMEEKDKKTGVIVQYGKYEYIEKGKNILDTNAEKIGFPYKKRGGLLFGEIEYNDFVKEFCTICIIKPIIKKHFSMTLKKFIDEVMKKGTWDYESYNFATHNCQDFAAAGISIINPNYNKELIYITNNANFKMDEEEDNLPENIIKQLNKNKIELK